jgi:hypothetical protein
MGGLNCAESIPWAITEDYSVAEYGSYLRWNLHSNGEMGGEEGGVTSHDAVAG